MVDHLISLCKYLLERGKSAVCKTGRVSKFYFVMLYPGNVKPVYSPLKIYLPISTNDGPTYIQQLWDERKKTIPPGTKLLAFASVIEGVYRPTDPEKDRMDKSGSLILISTMHMATRHISYGVLYELKHDDTIFDSIMELKDEQSDSGCALFPKNL